VDGNEAKLYFDGTEVDDETSTLTGGTVNQDADHLFVGGDTYYSSEKFRGYVDVLRHDQRPRRGDSSRPGGLTRRAAPDPSSNLAGQVQHRGARGRGLR
jgi:hypothetical protein